MNSINPDDRKIPQLTLPIDRKVSFEKKAKKNFSFLSPRGISSHSHGTPRYKPEMRSDEKLQHTVEKVWLEILSLIAKTKEQQQYTFRIPFSQGLLFGELLTNQSTIKTRADESGNFTIGFDDQLQQLARYHPDNSSYSISRKSEGSRASSATNLRERISHEAFGEFPDYLGKFLDISQTLLHCKEDKKRKFTVFAAGFDREFLKAALSYHYGDYIEDVSIGNRRQEPEILHISLRKGVHNLDDLIQKICRLHDLVQWTGVPASHSSEPQPSFCYQRPIDLSENPLFQSCRRNSSASSSHIEIAELDISDCELDPEDREERNNRVVSHVVKYIQQYLQGKVPDSINNADWKDIWQCVKKEVPSKSAHYQRKLLKFVSLKCNLAKASFELLKHLHNQHRAENSSKQEQMNSIPESDIYRCFYPDSAVQPFVHFRVNEKPLHFDKIPSDGTYANSISCFRTLLATLLEAQNRFSEWRVEQLINDIFPSQDIEAHFHNFQDGLIISMLKASTFSFQANALFVLKKKFDGEYKIKDYRDEMPTVDFSILPHGDCEAIRTDSYTLSRDETEIGRLITRLISSFSIDTRSWSYRLEIPQFLPSRNCSLLEQKWIHERLLAPDESYPARGHREKGKMRHLF